MATLKKTKIGFQDQLSLNAGQKNCRMYSAILSTFIKLQFVIKIFVLSSFDWPFYTGFTIHLRDFSFYKQKLWASAKDLGIHSIGLKACFKQLY